MSRAAIKTRSKYAAVKTTVDNITFHSKKEARRYGELKLLEKAGLIDSLQLQPEYPLHVKASGLASAIKLGVYRADFQYWETVQPGRSAPRFVVEDVKGFKTPLYRWKKKHVEAQYGITIQEL